MASVNTANWTYADWVTLTDASARLTRLALHIQEVSNAIVDAQTGRGRGMRVPAEYLASLHVERTRLEQSLAQQTAANASTRYPRVIRPSF